MKLRGLTKKLWNSKAFLMVFSLLLAVVLWFVTAEEATDEIQKTFDIPVTYIGESVIRDGKKLVLTDKYEGTAHIVLVGPKRVLKNMTDEDISAQIDLNKIEQAMLYSRPYTITYRDGLDTTGIVVSSRSPETVNFTISKWSTRTLDVRGSFDYNLPAGYACSAPSFEPSQITVSGPEIYLNELSHVFVSFGEENLTTTYSAETPVVLIDRDGEVYPVDGLELSNTSVLATLVIRATKTVPLKVNLIYGGGANEENVAVSITPEDITLSGDSSVLEGLNRIVLGSIDLRDFNASTTQVFPILYDETLTNDTGITEAKVQVEILSKLMSKTFTVDNISCTNVTEGYSVEFVTKQLEVLLRGVTEDLEAVAPENIRAVADLKDFNTTTGTVEVPVQIYVDGFTNVGTVGNEYKITVQIVKVNG